MSGPHGSFDLYVQVSSKSSIVQTTSGKTVDVTSGRRRGRVKEPDHRYHRLLRTRRERPRRRACKHRNTRASSHSITSSAGRRSWIESGHCQAAPALQADRIAHLDVARACRATELRTSRNASNRLTWCYGARLPQDDGPRLAMSARVSSV
jgi:hypothetical protein